MNDDEVKEPGRVRMISPAIVGIALGGVILFTTVMAFLTVNTAQKTAPKGSPPTTTGTAPSAR